MRAKIVFIWILIPLLLPDPFIPINSHGFEGELDREVPLHPVINEVLPNARKDWDSSGVGDYTDEWIELYNPTGVVLNLSGLILTDRSGSPMYHLEGELPPGGYLTLFRRETGIVLGSTDEVRLLSDNGTLLDSASFSFNFYDVSLARKPDGIGDFYIEGEPTCGSPNNPPPHLLINEVMVDPPGTNTGNQWIEIYNPGPDTNLTGMKLSNSEGFYYYLPSIHFPSGSYAVVYLREGEDTSTLYCLKLYTPREFYFFSSGDNLLLETYLGHPLDYVAWGRSTHIDPPPTSEGRLLWNGTYYNESSSTYEGGMENPFPAVGRSLSRLPSGRDTDSPLDWEVVETENITEGWNNSEPLILEVEAPLEVIAEPGRLVAKKITLMNLGPTRMTVNFTLISQPRGWSLSFITSHQLEPGAYYIETLLISPPSKSVGEPCGQAVYEAREMLGRKVWTFTLYLTLNLSDLSVESILFDPYYGGEYYQGELIEVSSRVYNRGVREAQGVFVRGYVEWEGGRWLFMERYYDSLGPGRYRIPSGELETYNLSGEVRVVVEAVATQGERAELNSTNNRMERNITLILPPPLGERSRLLITEVLVNVSFSQQYIKIYNPAPTSLSLEGLLLECSGVTAAFPEGARIPGFGNVTVAYDATEYRRSQGQWPDFFQREGEMEVPPSRKGDRMLTVYNYLKMYSGGGELILRTQYYQRIDVVVWGGGEAVRGWDGEPVPLPVRGWPLGRVGWPPQDTNTSADFLPPLPAARIVAVAPHDPSGYRAEYVVIKAESPISLPLLLSDGEGEVVLFREGWEEGYYVETLNCTSYEALTSLKPHFALEGYGDGVTRAELLGGTFALSNSGDSVALMDAFHRRLSEVVWGEGGVEPPGSLEALYVDESGEVLEGFSASTLPWAFTGEGATAVLTIREVEWGLPPGTLEGRSITVLSNHLLAWNISFILEGSFQEVTAVVDGAALEYLTQEERTRLFRNLLEIQERGWEVYIREGTEPPSPLPFEVLLTDEEIHLVFPLPSSEGEALVAGPLPKEAFPSLSDVERLVELFSRANETLLQEALSPLPLQPTPLPRGLVLKAYTTSCDVSFSLFRPPMGAEGEFTEVLTPPGTSPEELERLSGLLLEGARVLFDPSGRPTLEPAAPLEHLPGALLLSPSRMGRTPLGYLRGTGEELLYAPRAEGMAGAALKLFGSDRSIFYEIFQELFEEGLAPAATSPLILDRIYYNTATYGELDEFFAIYNPTPQPVDLSGYLVTDWEGVEENPYDGGVLLPRILLQPGEYLYLSRTGAYFELYWGEPPCLNYSWDFMTLFGDLRLANSRDSLTLISPTGEVVDRVVWGDVNVSGGWMGPTLPPFSSPRMLQRLRGEDYAPVDTDRWQDFDIFSSPSPGRSDFRPSSFNIDEGYLYVSPEGTLEALQMAVQLAREEILIEVYTISSPEAVQALRGALLRGVNVTLLVEGYPVGGISTSERWALKELYNMGASVYLLKSSTSEIRTERYRYVHSKFMVVDSRWLLIQSENLGESALPPPNSSGNRGWGVLLRSEGLAGYFREVFLCDLSGRYDVLPYSNALEELAPPEGYIPPVELGDGKYLDRFSMRCIRENLTATAVLSPDHPLRVLVEEIESARQEILVELLSMDLIFSFGRASHWINLSRPDDLYLQCSAEYWQVNPLLRALVEAAGRGVEVRVLMDSTDFDGDGEPDNAPIVSYLNTLSSTMGLTTLKARLIWKGSEATESVIEVLHNKGMVIDSERVLISSINWGQNSLTNNREAAVVLRGPPAASYYRQVFLWDWNQSALKDFQLRLLPGRFFTLPAGEEVSVMLSVYNMGLAPVEVSLVPPPGENLLVSYSAEELSLQPGETASIYVNITAGAAGDYTLIIPGEVDGEVVELGALHISAYEAPEKITAVGEGGEGEPLLYLIIIVLFVALIFDLLQRFFERRGGGGGDEE